MIRWNQSILLMLHFIHCDKVILNKNARKSYIVPLAYCHYYYYHYFVFVIYANFALLK